MFTTRTVPARTLETRDSADGPESAFRTAWAGTRVFTSARRTSHNPILRPCVHRAQVNCGRVQKGSPSWPRGACPGGRVKIDTRPGETFARAPHHVTTRFPECSDALRQDRISRMEGRSKLRNRHSHAPSVEEFVTVARRTTRLEHHNNAPDRASSADFYEHLRARNSGAARMPGAAQADGRTGILCAAL